MISNMRPELVALFGSIVAMVMFCAGVALGMYGTGKGFVLIVQCVPVWARHEIRQAFEEKHPFLAKLFQEDQR